MPESSQISTTTTLTVSGADLTIHTYYDPQNTGHLLSALIVDVPSNLDYTNFIEGELAMRLQHNNCASHLDFLINGDGELIVISYDNAFPASIYGIDQSTGEIQVTI
jgi:hypothetical protein